MPAGSEGPECGQRYPQRLAIKRATERPPQRREAVLFVLAIRDAPLARLLGFASFGRSRLGLWVTGPNAESRSAQNVRRPIAQVAASAKTGSSPALQASS